MPAKRATAPDNTAERAIDSVNDVAPAGAEASANISKRIAELADWRGRTLDMVRQLIHDAEPAVQEEWKWRGTPVWARDGGLCTGETYQQVVKLTFFRGAALPDPHRLFNASLEGGTRRAIDLRENAPLDPQAFKALIRAAVQANAAAVAQRASARAGARKAVAPRAPRS